jgi:hypothetical protein
MKEERKISMAGICSSVQIIPRCRKCGKYMDRELAEINGIFQNYYFCGKCKKHPIRIIEIWMDSRFKAKTENCDPSIGAIFAKVERKNERKK